MAIRAIEENYLKICSLDYDYFFWVDELANFDYFMGISYSLDARGVSLGEPSREMTFAIRNFHNLYLYQNESLDFPYANKNVPYAELTEEEKDNGLFILIPIFSSIGHPIGDIDYDTGTVTLDAEVRPALKEIQKDKNDISGKKRTTLRSIFEISSH